MSNEKSSWDQLYSGNTAARGLGARLTAEAKPKRLQQSTAEALGSAAISETTELETASAEEHEARVHTGFATEPGYKDDSFDAWGGRQIDDNPRYF
jgi:hypothetical protein